MIHRKFFSCVLACRRLEGRHQGLVRCLGYAYGQTQHGGPGRTPFTGTQRPPIITHQVKGLQRSLIITPLTLPFFKKVTHPGGPAPNPVLPSTTPIEISRIMLPDDTNPSGNVHGGTILKMIEHAGHIVGNRHCNRDREEGDPPITTTLVRLEKMDFHQPMLVGEVAQLQAAVTYTSPNSLEVVVDVWAENVITGERRHTNTAYLWYVGLKYNEGSATLPLRKLVVPMPQLEGLSKEEEEAGRRRYQTQKNSRKLSSVGGASGNGHTATPPGHTATPPSHVSRREVKEHSVVASQTTLANIVLPSNCTVTGHMLGGALMKIMDSAAWICAARHSRGHTVTACIDVINLHQPVMNGEMVFVTARMIFTSTKSMEIEVTTEAEGLAPGTRRVTNTAYFTFVCLGQDCRPVTIPPLQRQGEEEEQRFKEGAERYATRKAARLANM